MTNGCNCTPEFSGEPGQFLPFRLLLPMRTSQSREWWAVVSCGSWLELLTLSAGGDYSFNPHNDPEKQEPRSPASEALSSATFL